MSSYDYATTRPSGTRLSIESVMPLGESFVRSFLDHNWHPRVVSRPEQCLRSFSQIKCSDLRSESDHYIIPFGRISHKIPLRQVNCSLNELLFWEHGHQVECLLSEIVERFPLEASFLNVDRRETFCLFYFEEGQVLRRRRIEFLGLTHRGFSVNNAELPLAPAAFKKFLSDVVPGIIPMAGDRR